MRETVKASGGLVINKKGEILFILEKVYGTYLKVN